MAGALNYASWQDMHYKLLCI